MTGFRLPTARVAKPTVSARYLQYVRHWHTPTPGKTAPLDATGRPLLALVALNTNERADLQPASDTGGFGARDLDRAAHLLREPSSGNEHPVEPRAIDLIYRIQTHFRAEEIRVISGYRTAHGRGSNHGKGRAIDLIVPGASDQAVATYARELGFVGVGIYPTSGFVHIDARDRSYFWVDASGPRQRNRERGVFADLARKSDERAAVRGEHSTGPFLVGNDVETALRAALAAGEPTTPKSSDDDVDDDLDEGDELP